MRQLLLIACLIFSVNGFAQVLGLSRLESLCTQKYSALSAQIDKKYWKLDQQGKTDTMSYARWLPAKMDNNNVGEMIMVYYKAKTQKVDFIICQSLSKAYADKTRADLAKAGYKAGEKQTIKDGTREYFLNAKYEISIMTAKPDPKQPPIYVIGARPNVPAPQKQGAKAPVRKK